MINAVQVRVVERGNFGQERLSKSICTSQYGVIKSSMYLTIRHCKLLMRRRRTRDLCNLETVILPKYRASDLIEEIRQTILGASKIRS